MVAKILAFLGSVIVIFVALSFIYAKIQKPSLVNDRLVLENKLRVPPLLEPTEQNGEKTFNLTLQKGTMEFMNGKQTNTWGVNGSFLGPTIRIRNGDAVHMRLLNNLDEATSMHWHGMYLPAAMDGGPHQGIEPGTTWDPLWNVKQQAATLWYHPHLMRVTGKHVYNGLAGMILIDDENSDSLSLPRTYGVDDIPVIVQDRKFDSNGQFVHDHTHNQIPWDAGQYGDTILVNGTYAPYVDISTKRIRLRLLNGSNARRYNFGFSDNRVFHQISTDGGLLEAPVPLTRLLLSPGERADIIVEMKNNDPVILMSYAVDIKENIIVNMVKGLFKLDRDETEQYKLLELRPKTDLAESEPLPQKLNTIIRLKEKDAAKTRRFRLSPDQINGKSMDHKRIDEVIRKGDIEIWEISSPAPPYHPFHIHDVQFLILDRNGKPPPQFEQGWKDTVHLQQGDTVRIIAQFKDYSNPHMPYMFHCHILEHEDMGMMGQFVVVDDVNQEVSVDSDLPAEHKMEH